MSLGIQPTKAQIDTEIGNVFKTLNTAFINIEVLKIWVDSKPDQDLIDLGYTSQEVAVMKSAFADADKLRSIYEGRGTQPSGYDHRTFLKQIFGFGYQR